MCLAPRLASLVNGQPRFYPRAGQSPGRCLNINYTATHAMQHSPIAQKPTTALVYLRLQRTRRIVCRFSIHGVFYVASTCSGHQCVSIIICHFPVSNIRAVLNITEVVLWFRILPLLACRPSA